MEVLILAILAAAIASGSGKWESEDQAQYEAFNPRVKLVREAFVPQLPLRSDHVLGEIPHRIVEKPSVFYCFESQSQDDARRIMHENHVQYLIVLNNELRVLGTLWMEDLA
jgi:CBS domain-containing protein